ncbi:hypothetical protein [Curtobacterium sp. UCD-KPL2560]|uniref:hypothetical protein n=1 Tax=Curtobacterium sp. UCD-KPL2560 TaxID=1885315 RepID=UPI000824AE30|nr:hypothetical protein [Curtobacterium sp. UCD-KPL2560]
MRETRRSSGPPLRSQRRSGLRYAVTIALTSLLLTGCSPARPTQYHVDPAVSRLPVVAADSALVGALPPVLRAHVVATGTSAEGGFAIALAGGRCAVAVLRDSDPDVVSARVPRSSDDPVSTPTPTAARYPIGPSTSVAAATTLAEVTLWCGTEGAAITLRPGATFTTTGTIEPVTDATDTASFVTSAKGS